jgi:tungstate transport system substrate-binding protein
MNAIAKVCLLSCEFTIIQTDRKIMKQFMIILFSFLMVVLTTASITSADTTILCASTTSTQNSGLFEHILPVFEKKTGIKVKVIAVGTGAALEIGKRGDADVVIVHSRDDELKMVQKGWFVNRHDLMYNDFIVVGPPSDPAGVNGMKEARKALGNIASANESFVSRGDNSGTNKKEIKLWKSAGLDPKGKEWYMEVGQGMAKTLRIAGEKRAYTLTDRGTYLSVKDKERIALGILLEGDPELFNQYGVMAVNPEKYKSVKYKEAMKFIDWLVSKEGQAVIASFKDNEGKRLFYPNAR